MRAFYSVGQLWYESRVSWRLKRCFFIGRVVNTALSGIEAFCPSKAQYQSLTSLVTCLARRVMAGATTRMGDHGRVRTMSNKGVLRFWKLAPCDVEAQVRRLKWAQTLVQDPSHHTQLITAMFGKLPSQRTPEANPWAVRWMADLEELGPYDERGVIQRMGPFWIANWRKILLQWTSRYYDCGRWLSRSHRGIFGKRRVTQWNRRRKEFHNGGAVLTNNVRLGSSRSRLWQRTCCGITDKWSWCLDR